MKKSSVLVLIMVHVFSLIGCSNNNEIGNENMSLLISEKTLPHNFSEVAVKREQPPYYQYLIKRAANKEQYEQLSKYFGITSFDSNVNLDNYDLYFVGVYESGTCRISIKDMKIDSDNKKLILTLVEKKGNCTADATPRTFLIKVEKEISQGMKDFIIIERDVETIVNLGY